MCFTVNVNLIKEELENRYGATLIDPDSYRPSYYYHAFNLPTLPAICSADPSKIRLLQWGLIPPQTKDADQANSIRYKTFNARSETLETKSSFKSSFKTNRCIIPVKGFFEWQHLGKEKRPWYIYLADNEIMSLAGIYDNWTETSTGEIFSTFSIITSEANDLLAVIHNSTKRMPVILNNGKEKKWLNVLTSPEDALSLLDPCPSEILKAHTIGPLINSKTADKNTQEVIRPYIYPQDNLLF